MHLIFHQPSIIRLEILKIIVAGSDFEGLWNEEERSLKKNESSFSDTKLKIRKWP